MANIKRGAAIVFAGVVRVRWEIAGAASIAARIVQRIVSESGKLRAHSNAAVHDELILLEDPFRLILEDIALIRKRALIAVCRIRRIDIVREKRVDSARVQVRNSEICRLAELALQAHTRLHRVGRSQM